MTEANRPHDQDFVDKALHQFDHVLDVVHDKVLRPLLLAGRAIAFGFIILLAVFVLVVALIIGLIRLLDVYCFAGHEYITYGSIGFLCVVAGMVIWRKRRPVNLRK